MSNGKVLLGVLAGVAVGATLGILFAPDKGSVTRKKITQKGDDYADELGDKFESFLQNISQKFMEMREEAMKAANNGVVKAGDVKEEVETAVKKA